MSPRLLVNPGTPQAWEIRLKPGTNRIGRNEANDFQIPHGSISGAHCEFVVGASSVSLKDLGSTNGTFVNRNRVTEIALQPGQHIQLGAVDLIYEVEAADAPSAPATTAPAPVRVVVPTKPTSAASGPVRLSVPVASPGATAPSPPLPPPVSARPAGLRLSGSHTAQPTAAPPPSAPAHTSEPPAEPAPPPLAPVPLSAGAQFCKSHPRTPARFYCPTCQKFFCDLCVGTRAGPGGAVHTCRACGANVTPVQVHIVRPEANQPSFYKSLPGAFAYPFRGFGIVTLLLAGFLFGGDEYLGRMGFYRGPFGWMMRTVIFGFLFLYLQNIIHTTTSDENEPLGFPEAGGFFGAAFELAMTVLVSFGLAIALFAVRLFTDIQVPGAAMVAAIIVGCLYFPMAFLAIAMKDSVMAANPLIVIPTIMKIPLEYLVTTVLLMAVFGMKGLGSLLSEAAGRMAFTTRSSSTMLLGLAAQAGLALAGVYLLTVCVRVLGILYNRKKQQFGWFSH